MKFLILLLLILFFLIFIIPIKIVVDYEYYSKDYDINDEDVKREFKIYILRFIRVKKIIKKKDENNNKNININNKKNTKILYNLYHVYKKYHEIQEKHKEMSRSNFKRLKENIYIKKIYLDLGFNTKNIIYNSYIMSMLNSYISSFIAKNIEIFNLKETVYRTYISRNLLKIKIHGIVNLKLANTIVIVTKFILENMKGGKYNGKETTSNRKSNANSYDFS